MNKEEIINLIDQKMQQQQMKVGGLSISSHTHNGTDSPRINSFNIITNNEQGFIFPSNTVKNGSFNLHTITNPGNGQIDLLSIDSFKDGSGTFALGANNRFHDIDLFASSVINLSTDNLAGTIGSSVLVHTDNVSLASHGSTFYFRLPDSPRPTSLPFIPPAGAIAFDSGNFYVCKSAGTWTLLI